MPASRLLSLGGLFTTLSTTLALTPAGNENYASQARALRSSSQGALRSRSGPLKYEATSVSFSVGEGDDVKDYLSPIGSMYKSHTLASNWGLEGLKGSMMPVTVFNVEGEVTCSTLGGKVASFSSSDDVWDESFMQAIILQTTSSFHVASEVADCATTWGGNLIIKSGNATSDIKDIGLAHVESPMIPQGPYMAKIDGDVTLTEIYRVYRDQAMAMTTAVIPAVDGTFTDMSVPTNGLNTLSIPVPSRLYTLDIVNPRPLEGRRIAVKDIYDMAGLKTGCGNRAYFDFYPARDVTAPSIQRLVDQGAIIVARSKTSSFANGESAAGDWVEQISPFNPRGDGYQQPSSSSSGPGAAMGAYDWLDNAIGSDTGCSILCPSGAQGLFGMRPTHGAITLEGVMPLEPALDTAGFFARNAVTGRDFSKGWYGDRFENFTSFPTTVILPNASWTFDEGSAAAPVYAKFRSAFLDFLKPTSVDESPSFEALWNSTGNFDSAGNRSLSALVGPIYTYLINHYQWFNFAAPWFEEYAAVNDDRLPQIPPVPTSRWGNGRVNVTDEIYAQSLADKQTYMDFISENVLVADNETCSSTIYAYPYNTGESPSYRDTYSGGPVVRNGGLGANTISPFMAENPSLIVPIGQVPYDSRITNHTEYLPAVVVLMAARNCDYMLWDLAAAMQEAGVISPVLAGRLAYAL